MIKSLRGRTNYNKIFGLLLQDWIVCFGSLTLLILGGWFLPYVWLPFLGYALVFLIILFGNYSFNTSGINCSIVTHYTVYALFVASTIMLGINIVNTSWFQHHLPGSINPKNPFVTTVIVYPVSALTFLCALLRFGKPAYCIACKQRASFSVNDTLEFNLLHNQTKEQLKVLLFITSILSIVILLYFHIYYINININSPDKFYFYITPLIIYVISVAYKYFKYTNMKFQINMSPNGMGKNYHTNLRYIVIKEDKILLEKLGGKESEIDLFDTPATTEIEYVDKISMAESHDIFKNISGSDDFELKYLFSTNTEKHNTFHYAAFLNSKDDTTPGFGGDWLNLYQIDIMLKSGLISRAFAYEIHRIFTMTMAWKTYNREGERLYPIKNYRPTFRIVDFRNWDLNYEDMHWLRIAENNEDKPFFRVKKFWRKYISGVDRQWKNGRS